MNKEIRKITDGAMMTAVLAVIFLINRQTAGAFEGFLIYAYPLPMVFYGAKYGWKQSWMVFAAVVLLAFILSTIPAALIAAGQALIGMIYGCGIYHKTASGRLVLRTILLSVAIDMATMVVFSGFFGYNLTAELAEYKNIMNTAMGQAGVSLPQSVNLDQMLSNLMFTAVIITGVLDGLVIHFLARILLKRLRFDVKAPLPLREYFPPKWSGYLAAIGAALLYVSLYRPFAQEIVQNACQGFGMISQLWLLFFGAVAIVMVLRALNPDFPKGAAVLLAILVTMMANIAVMIIGFLYLTTNLHEKALEGGLRHAA